MKTGEDSSFLQITLKRIENFKNLESPIVICNDEHRFITAEQIRKINITPKSILLEPCSKNTASAIAIAALHAISNKEDPLLLILPADHLISNNQDFLNAISKATYSASTGKIVTFGVKPTAPATGYGYIKAKTPLDKNLSNPIPIDKFIEKPNQTLANKLFLDKRYSWNSGIFIAKASTLINELMNYSPETIEHCKDSLKNKIKDLDFERLSIDSFKKCPNISIDKAVMEKTSLGVVLPLNVKWSDIGGWQSFWENSPKDKNGNVLIGDALEISSKNCLINSNSRITVGLGVENLIIVETNDAVLVANKDVSENVKTLVSLLKERNRIEGEENTKVYRPWGNYFTVEHSSKWKIKKIEVNPGASLSLQIHKKRAEHWIVVEGSAKVEINNIVSNLNANQSCFVPMGAKHRLSNPKKEKLTIIEVQSGEYLGEDDIIRLKDNYGRTN